LVFSLFLMILEFMVTILITHSIISAQPLGPQSVRLHFQLGT
jgi:hypothetical protein